MGTTTEQITDERLAELIREMEETKARCERIGINWFPGEEDTLAAMKELRARRKPT